MTTPPPTSAYDVLREQYRALGLEALAEQIIGYQQEGLDQNEAYLRLRTTTEYKTRFAGNQMRIANNQRELTEAEYVQKERDLADQFASYQLPKGFYDDPSDFARAIAADLGGGELKERLEARKQIVESGEFTGVLAYAKEHYGLGTGDMIAFFIDPDRAQNVFTTMREASKIGAAAGRTGYGALGTAEAEKLANLGVTADAAQQGFAQAASLRELESAVGGDEAVSREDITGAIFQDDNTKREKVERAQNARRARFQGGGTFAESREGITGLGSANTA